MLFLIWIAAIIILTLAWILRRYIFNAYYILAVIIDALKDIACQLWIDLENGVKWMRRLFRRKIDLDQSEDFYHRDC